MNMDNEKIAQELVAVAKELTGVMRGDSRFKKSVELMSEMTSDANAIMAEVMKKHHMEEAEAALEPAGGRRELQKVWNNLTRVSLDLKTILRRMN